MKTVLAVLLLLASRPALAESWVPECSVSWWTLSTFGPDSVTGLSPTPKVILPAVWHGNGAPPPLDETAVTVTVRDPSGAAVPGQLGVGVTSSAHAPPELSRRMWWTPDAALAPATYTLTLEVQAPAPSDAFNGCSYQAFSRALSFTVSAEPAPTPVVSLSAAFDVGYVPQIVHGTECGVHPLEGACPNSPAACCWFARPGPVYMFTMAADIDGLDAGGGYYFALEVEFDCLGPHPIDRQYLSSVGPTWAYEQRHEPDRASSCSRPTCA